MCEDKDRQLAGKLHDVGEFISNLKPKKYEDGWHEDHWEEEMEKHPIFMSKPPEEGQELPPLVEAMQQLKYDPDVNSPIELAKSYKEDGNQNFKRKKYRWAVEAYTKGLDAKCDDNELNAQLYVNRAASHFHIGNHRKSLSDATKAVELKCDYLKAYQRGALCCMELRLFEDCISWCNKGLNLNEGDATLLDLKQKAEEKQKIEDRNKRKAASMEAKASKEIEDVKKAIRERGINIAKGDLGSFEPTPPALTQKSRVHLNAAGELIWPVIFLYPEYGVSDYIQKFHEDAWFTDHLEMMFAGDDLPSWDKEQKYLSENLEVHFCHEDKLITVCKKQPLRGVLSDKRYKVNGGTPCFMITVKDSEFHKEFIKKHA